MNKNKERIIKSGALLVATALVLVVVTVAWFISGGDEATVDQISADVESSSFRYSLYEAVDSNRNGLLDNGEENNWQLVTGDNIDISSIVPNQYRFYKAIIYPGDKTKVQLWFRDVVVTVDAPATQRGLLEKINVRFRTVTDLGLVTTQDRHLYYFSTRPNPYWIFNLTITPDQLDEYLTIYYDVGVYPNFAPGAGYQGASVSIGKIEFLIF